MSICFSVTEKEIVFGCAHVRVYKSNSLLLLPGTMQKYSAIQVWDYHLLLPKHGYCEG